MEKNQVRALALDALLKLRGDRPHARFDLGELCAVAGLPPADVGAHFGSLESIVMSVTDECVRAPSAALQRLPPTIDLQDTLFLAHIGAMAEIRNGGSNLEIRHILGAMKEVALHPVLDHHVTKTRNRMYSLALTRHRGGGVDPRSLAKTITIWSAVMGGVYVDLVGEHRRHPVTEDSFFDELDTTMVKVYPLVTGRAPMI